MTTSLWPLPAAFAAVIHLVEVLVHAIDFAVATDQRHLVDQTLCEQVLASLVVMGGVDAYRAPGTSMPRSPPPRTPRQTSGSGAYLGRDLTLELVHGPEGAAVTSVA